ncbi:iron-containing alcohol dehydrogenase [Terasakiella sp. A23]|uniref:iron-containing alcohol dehydrogenase n=1 Tax=Terasakiella sp. FCG-A23 TaxID=3080561 RepID=UPI002954D2D8|nr:iron-containing alcohol dehydrogenase [Terasakiella sp. A23]MDV7341233.1 iron-containing alcohol dehydrogenase [Terasakiella sp. A23]
MNSFVFNTTKSIICEPGCIEKLGLITKQHIGSRILLVTDPGLLKLGLLDGAVESLKQADIKIEIFSDVVADPPAAIVEQACDVARKAKIDGVIGLGGGSSMDVAKLVALLVGGGEKLEDIYGVNMATQHRLPLIQIPTTAGTGSEVTPISIITVGKTEKKGVVAPQLLPDVALLDADLTLGLPASITAATGIDAMVHAIEAYTSKSVNNNPVSKTLALEALRLLSANIETVVRDPKNKEARSNMLLGSTLAGQAFANSPVAAVHALAYPLGGIFHVPHGLSNALMLSHVMRFNASHCTQAYYELAPSMFSELAQVSGLNERVEALIAKTASLCTDLGLESTLREVGVSESDLPTLASEAMKQTRLLVNNPRDVSEDHALSLYQAAF